MCGWVIAVGGGSGQRFIKCKTREKQAGARLTSITECRLCLGMSGSMLIAKDAKDIGSTRRVHSRGGWK